MDSETYLHRILTLSKNPRMERIFQTKLYLYDIPYFISNFPTKMKLYIDRLFSNPTWNSIIFSYDMFQASPCWNIVDFSRFKIQPPEADELSHFLEHTLRFSLSSGWGFWGFGWFGWLGNPGNQIWKTADIYIYMYICDSSMCMCILSHILSYFW